MLFKKILLVLICLIFSSSLSLAFSLFDKAKKSPFLKLPKMLGNGTIVTFQSYDVADFRQILGGVYKSNSVEITGHIAFPISDGTASNKVPVVIIIHSSGGPTEITDGWKNWFRDIQQPLLKSGIGVFYIDSFSARGVKHTYEYQYKASIISQSIDTVMAYKFLKTISLKAQKNGN